MLEILTCGAGLTMTICAKLILRLAGPDFKPNLTQYLTEKCGHKCNKLVIYGKLLTYDVANETCDHVFMQ